MSVHPVDAICCDVGNCETFEAPNYGEESDDVRSRLSDLPPGERWLCGIGSKDVDVCPGCLQQETKPVDSGATMSCDVVNCPETTTFDEFEEDNWTLADDGKPVCLRHTLRGFA